MDFLQYHILSIKPPGDLYFHSHLIGGGGYWRGGVLVFERKGLFFIYLFIVASGRPYPTSSGVRI